MELVAVVTEQPLLEQLAVLELQTLVVGVVVLQGITTAVLVVLVVLV